MADFSFNSNVKLATATLAAIDAATLRDADNGFRPHLGASLIGRSCERQLYYVFHWAKAASFEPRILRLFGRGQREEDTFANLLRSAGVTIHQVDPATGKQFQFSSCGGHFGGSMDGAGVKIPDAPATWHVIEMKTHGKKSYDVLVKDGVRKAKPEHWFQMQCYMKWTGMTRALYMAVCKDDDRLHLERIDYDEVEASRMFERAERIINCNEPPQRIGSADWYECKFCDFRDICHGTEAPAVNCRTCAHSTAEKAGYWSCARNCHNEIPVQSQKLGCDGHRYIPKMLHWAEMTSGSDTDNWVKYQMHDGGTFVNGYAPEGLSSQEIQAATDKKALALTQSDEYVRQMRHEFGGKLVG